MLHESACEYLYFGGNNNKTKQKKQIVNDICTVIWLSILNANIAFHPKRFKNINTHIYTRSDIVHKNLKEKKQQQPTIDLKSGEYKR